MGEDGAALSGEAERSWAERQEQPTFVEAVLWIASTGSPWRDLPAAFGHWNSVFTRFRDWATDVWKRLFEAVSDDPDVEYAMVGCHQVLPPRSGRKRRIKAKRLAARKAA